MANNDDHKPGEPSHIHLGPKHEGKKFNWLPWLLLALGLLALLFALSRCGRDEAAVAPVVTNETDTTVTNTTTTTTTTSSGSVNLPGGTVLAVTPGGLNEQVAGFLAGTDPTPSRAFQFDRLNFDTSRSEIRPQDQEDLNQMAQILKAYPNARIRVVGYADARGSDPANQQLGLSRANSVRQALVAQGIQENRIETASGGEQDPVDTNATAQGQAENRRTEVVIVSR
ncbi:OmpA family protein [Sphingomonas lenta]|uniref:Flagellar motor protein MotB n=1 Tax=Sphingomonas lenta TaxID=1141887 RepID=A0A2A2SFW2_9SPHN|nr:OmpA family protein [Sphingomonas lenta]PAX08080.1 flagellar motor protein MotB [Sphingomonas lenta]